MVYKVIEEIRKRYSEFDNVPFNIGSFSYLLAIKKCLSDPHVIQGCQDYPTTPRPLYSGHDMYGFKLTAALTDQSHYPFNLSDLISPSPYMYQPQYNIPTADFEVVVEYTAVVWRNLIKIIPIIRSANKDVQDSIITLLRMVSDIDRAEYDILIGIIKDGLECLNIEKNKEE